MHSASGATIIGKRCPRVWKLYQAIGEISGKAEQRWFISEYQNAAAVWFQELFAFCFPLLDFGLSFQEKDANRAFGRNDAPCGFRFSVAGVEGVFHDRIAAFICDIELVCTLLNTHKPWLNTPGRRISTERNPAVGCDGKPEHRMIASVRCVKKLSRI